jgi:type II secretory pathway component PulJ
MTMVEAVVAVSLLVTVFGLALPAIVIVMRSVGGEEQRALANDEAHVAMAQLERDVRSGNVIGSPSAFAGLDGMEFRVFTQTNGAPFSCVHYRVQNDRLERRVRPAGGEHVGLWPSGWQLVASGVLNRTENPIVPAFTRSADKQTLTVALVLRTSDTSKMRISTAITGRNTKYYDTPFAGDQCA